MVRKKEKTKRRQILLLFMGILWCIGGWAQSYNWGSVAIGGGGFVAGLLNSRTEKGLMYARTDVGGAYRRDVSTGRWIALTDWVSQNQTGYLGVESFAIDPQATNKLYMLVGISYFNNGNTAILRSSDYGATFSITDISSLFKAHGNGMGRQNGEKLQVDPNNGNILFCGSRRNGLFKSTDAGVNWTRVSSLNITSTPNDNGISFVYIDPNSGSKGNASQTIYVGISRSASPNMYISKDGGASFNALSGAPTAVFMPQRVSVANDGIMYINFADGAGPNGNGGSEPMGNGAIWKYNIKTGAWTNVTPSGIAKAWGGISVDPANSNRVVASTINNYQIQGNNGYGDRFYLSTNGGSSWTDVVARGFTLDTDGNTWIANNAIHWAGSIEFDPFDTKKVSVTSGNGVFTNTNIDASGTWKFDVRGLEETVPLDFISIPNGPAFSVIGDYDGFKHVDITQYGPIHNPRMGTSSGIAYAGMNTNKLLRVGGSMYYSTNQGTSWVKCGSMNGTQGKVAVSADGNTFLHCPDASSTTYRSINNGSSWSTVNGLNISNAFPKADPVNSNKFYAYNSGNGTMYVSTDGGANFSAAGFAGNGGSQRIETVPGKEGHLWVAMNGGGLTRSTNSGQSFTKINGVSNCSEIGLGKAASGSTYLTIYLWGTVNGVQGVFRSTNEGASWTRVNDDAHEYGGPGNGQFVIGDMNVYGRVFMSTAGRGVAYGEPSGTVTDIETQEISSSEESSGVHCYPNPFSEELNLTTQGEFDYTLFDLAGIPLLQGHGQQTAQIGKGLAPGLYVVKIQTSTGSKVVKVNKL